MRLLHTALLFFLLLSAIAFADSASTQGGNITIASPFIPSSSIWYGLCGTVSNDTFQNVTVNATAGVTECINVSTGAGNCTYGASFINILFSNSSSNITSLSAGNLSTLDSFVANDTQNGTATFTANSTFNTSEFGNITGVPTAYTQPSASHAFREGYLQDQDGNLVFLARAANATQAGFNGSLYDFQAILPTQNGAGTVNYFVGVDLSCATSGTVFSQPENFTVGPAGAQTNITIERNATFVSTLNQTTFALSITNTGNVPSGTFEVKEEIPDSVATSPSQISFSLQPTRFETGSIIAVWDLSSLSPNQSIDITYTVQKVVTSLANFTISINSLSAQVPPPPPPVSQPPATTVSPGLSPAPTIPLIILPPKPPSLNSIMVTSFAPFRQVFPGENIVVSQLLENPTSSPVSFSMSIGGPQSTMGEVENVVLAAGEKRTIPLQVGIPAEAKPGYYLLSIKLASGSEEVSFPSVMQVVKLPVGDEPSVQRQFLLDYNTNTTTIALTLTNQKNAAIPLLQLSETIPPAIAAQASNRFTLGPTGPSGSGSIEGASIVWNLENIKPYETRTLTYGVPLLLTDMSTYPGWGLSQLAEVSPGPGEQITLTDVKVSSMLPGEKGWVSMNVVNTGVLAQNVTVSILLPPGWKAEQRVFDLSLSPRSLAPLTILFSSSEGAQPGTYGMQLRLSYGDKFSDRNIFIYVANPELNLFAPPLVEQFSGWAAANAVLVAAAVAALGLAFFGGKALLFRLHAPRFNKERLDSLKKLQEMFERKPSL